MGLGLTHYIPFVAYLGFWVMCLVSLTGRPLYGLYYMMPFLPYRTMRDHFLGYPLGGNMLTILIVCVLIGALLHGKRLPKSGLYLTWVVFGLYLYLSLWIGTMISNAPAPLWLSDINFVTWKDYMVLPLIFAAAALVIEDRKAVRTVIILTAVTLLLIDRSSLGESLSRSWAAFDENKREGGPLGLQSNELAAFLAQFGVFFWGFGQFMKRKKAKLLCYGLSAISLFATMYTFSRGAYAAVLVSIVLLAVVKDRKLLVAIALFLMTWQAIVPVAVKERVNMTENSNGVLEASAQERVDLWQQSEQMFLSSPVFGTGFATFQLQRHVGNLRDTHNWYVKVLAETGIIGGILALILLIQMLSAAIRLFRRGNDPMYRGLGLGFLLALCSCLVANCFGDRWTYVEINGLLWVLTGATVRSLQLAESVPVAEEQVADPRLSAPSHLAWR
ncbi:MAG: O-antigen ligase family protein [Acidobacteriota bacterium]|nr:O-antigen ligase family protein [Acidobacteriota bacterium]